MLVVFLYLLIRQRDTKLRFEILIVYNHVENSTSLVINIKYKSKS